MDEFDLPWCILQMEKDPKVLIEKTVAKLNEIARASGLETMVVTCSV